jgi:type VI secretion system protein ImpK
MSDDPFGKGDRTVIRPNPGGRLPQAPQPAQPSAPSNAPQPMQPQRAVSSPWDDWTSAASRAPSHEVNPYSPPSGAAAPYTPAPLSPHVSAELVTVGGDALMRSAASLLLLLGRLRASLSRAGAGQLMDQVAQSITQFETDARAAGAPPDQVQVAKYALAATADDIVQNLPSDGRNVWTQYSMLVRFFSERTGGVRFFQELDKAKQNPAVNLGLLQLMHACLSLGFEGVYRATGGAGALQGLRRDLYETIRRAQPKTIEELSPHWRGLKVALIGSRFEVPIWAAAALAGVVLLGAYLVFRNLLVGDAEALALKMAAVHPDGEVTVARAAPVPPPPPPPPKAQISTQLERVRKVLADEILAGKVSADQTPSTIFVRVGSLVLFQQGGANVSPSFAPIAKKIAASLDKEPGPITIDGYTDSDPVKTLQFPSNFELSAARARSVAAMLKPDLTDPTRVVVNGKGADNPVAPNDVEANKAKNRRVEISIPRAD